MRGKEESTKTCLKLNIQKTKIMATGHITSWQTDGETMDTLTDFLFLGCKITADSDCSHKIRKHLPLRRKAMTNLDNVLKSRDITLPTKVRLVKAIVFPLVIYGCESWTIKKAECQRIDAFALWCWKRLSRVTCTARRWNWSILKEINPENSLEGLMLKLKLKLWYFGHLMQRADSLVKTLTLGKTEVRARGQQRMRWLVGITDSGAWVWANSRRQWRTRKTWHTAVHGISKNQTWLSNWTTATTFCSEWDSRNVAQAKLNHFCFTSWIMHFLITLSTFSSLNKEGR